MKSRIIASLISFMAILGMAMVGVASAGEGRSAYKLEGAWIAKVDGSTGQWTYVLSPDASGRRASGHGSIDIGLFVSPDSDTSSPILTEMEMTGRNTLSAYSVWYGLKELSPIAPLDPTRELIYIGVVQSTGKFVTPNKLEVSHYFEFYDQSADEDGDGLPDPGQDPFATLNLTTSDTRLPSP
jgi:hypothetical protein